MRTDERGAVLVVGLFAAVFLVGLLYFVFGIGETIRHHERMNDGADAGAYAVGVMHARAMNLVALGNMVKLTVVAILAAYLAIMTGAAMTIAWIASSKWRLIRYGWVIPALVAILLQALSEHQGFEGEGTAALRATDAMQRTMRDDLPTIALLKADAVIAPDYAPPVLGLASAPDLGLALKGMPIAPGSAFDLCQRAFPYSLGMVLRASRDVPSSRPRSRFLRYATATILPYCLTYGAEAYEMTDDQLGGEAFQIRIAAYGEPLPALGERGVRVAARGEPDGSAAAMRDRVSRVAIAQSEYYFDGPQDADEMLWRMEWRARMRRWRKDGSTAIGGAIDSGYFPEAYR